jgi:hypothetical protein
MSATWRLVIRPFFYRVSFYSSFVDQDGDLNERVFILDKKRKKEKNEREQELQFAEFPAVQLDDITVHEEGFLRAEEENHVRNVLWLADAQRDAFLVILLPFSAVLHEQIPDDGRVDQSWHDGLRLDVVRDELLGGCLRHADDACFGCCVGDLSNVALGSHAGDVDDAPVRE